MYTIYTMVKGRKHFLSLYPMTLTETYTFGSKQMKPSSWHVVSYDKMPAHLVKPTP